MRINVRALGVLCLGAVLTTARIFQPFAVGQDKDRAPKPPAVSATGGKNVVGKARVQGYTRTNRKTGQAEQVRPHKRRLPGPKPVQVQPYTRGGKPVEGHERRPPAKPSEGGPAVGRKAQGILPLRSSLYRWSA